MKLPSQKILQETFSYNNSSGELSWKFRPEGKFKHPKMAENWNRRFSNKSAGADNGVGYIRVTLTVSGKKKSFYNHRIIYKMVYGSEPEIIDHIDGNTSNNRIGNLRSTSLQDNNKNKGYDPNSKSGVMGVHWAKRQKKWCAQISNGRKIRHLGFFKDIEEAKNARKNAEILYGFHINHGGRSFSSHKS